MGIAHLLPSMILPCDNDNLRQRLNTFDRIIAVLYGSLVQVNEVTMTIQTTYTQARAQLASLLDQVANDHEVVIFSAAEQMMWL
jgi:hypothetical protein